MPLTSTAAARSLGHGGMLLVAAWLSVACSSSSNPSAEAPAAPSTAPPTFGAYTHFNERSYPVCGVAIGPAYGELRVIGPLDSVLGTDATLMAPRPEPVQYALAGRFVLKVAPGCEQGTELRIEPPSAARIVTTAPAADGQLAGAEIEASTRKFSISGTGAATFVQEVALACPAEPNPCPKDPRKDDGVAVPTISPTFTPLPR
ncbi:MAG: hypothetical protein ACT4QG_01035 [Sporichthyaceae bacterium]